MATITWIDDTGNWNTGADWSGGAVPGASDDATISNSGNYTISITTAIDVNSITIADTGATLFIAASGDTATVAAGLSNSGTLDVDTSGDGGSTLSIGGTLSNTGVLQIGNGNLTAPTTVAAADVSNTGRIDITGSDTEPATLDIAGAAPATLTGAYDLVGDTGGATLEYGSGGISQIGDGATNAGALDIDGANAFVETGATNSNSALTGLAT
ncbi:MAG TPA: hypothetical protein VMF86_01520, partial [Stellaceae bacterium]|nr:hypothetical protein [Stellaceae bacterium]